MTTLFLEIEKVKKWLRLELEYMEEDDTIEMLMVSAESYLMGAVDDLEDKIKDPRNLAVVMLICQTLIVDWYDTRDYSGGINEKQRYTLQSLLLQLQTAPIKTVVAPRGRKNAKSNKTAANHK